MNVELADAALQACIDNPEMHDQSTWRTESYCGTTMCYAGWVSTLAGGEWHRDRDRFFCIKDPTSKREYSVPGFARMVLDMTDEEANYLFYECEDVYDLKEALQRIKEVHASDSD